METKFPKNYFTCKMRTICEVHREIFDILYELEKEIPSSEEKLFEIVEKLTEATYMAKRMSNKLYEYKYDVTQNSDENYNYEKSKAIRDARPLHSK